MSILLGWFLIIIGSAFMVLAVVAAIKEIRKEALAEGEKIGLGDIIKSIPEILKAINSAEGSTRMFYFGVICFGTGLALLNGLIPLPGEQGEAAA